MSNPEQCGTCYEDAWRFLIKQGEGFLVHGTVRLYEGGREVKHAWVELPTGWVWEPQTKSYFTLKDFEITSPIEEHRYTVEEAAIMLARVGRHGPWSDEERSAWLTKSSKPYTVLKKGDVVPGYSYRGRYNLLAFRYGYEVGDVWEQSEDIKDCIDVARNIFELEEDELSHLAAGEKVTLRPNPYMSDYLQIITIPSRD